MRLIFASSVGKPWRLDDNARDALSAAALEHLPQMSTESHARLHEIAASYVQRAQFESAAEPAGDLRKRLSEIQRSAAQLWSCLLDEPQTEAAYEAKRLLNEALTAPSDPFVESSPVSVQLICESVGDLCKAAQLCQAELGDDDWRKSGDAWRLFANQLADFFQVHGKAHGLDVHASKGSESKAGRVAVSAFVLFVHRVQCALPAQFWQHPRPAHPEDQNDCQLVPGTELNAYLAKIISERKGHG